MKSESIPLHIGHSALFRSLDGLKSRLSHCSDPIELVFPARRDENMALFACIDSISAAVIESGVRVMSVHAPPLEMAFPGFLDDAAVLARLAESVGASAVTLHPSRWLNGDGRDNRQSDALENLRKAQNETPVTLAVETLAHSKCLFTDEEIAGFELPMVLDTTHIGWDRSRMLARRCRDRIVTVHLSEHTESADHQRIGQASLEFVDFLMGIGWTGNIVLEYWPWRWKCYGEDILKIKDRLGLD